MAPDGNKNSPNPQVTVALIGCLGAIATAIIAGVFTLISRQIDRPVATIAAPPTAVEHVASVATNILPDVPTITPVAITPFVKLLNVTVAPNPAFEVADFTLNDAQNNPVTLYGNLRDRHVVLVFYYAYT